MKMAKAALASAVRVARPLFSRADEVLVIPPADSGSSGDQAMLEATAAALLERGRRVSVLHVRLTQSPIALRANVDYVPNTRASFAERLGRQVAAARAGAVASLGADVIDGVYGPEKELRRFDVMAAAARRGARVAVLGCSISKTPNPAVAARIRALPEIVFHLRDEISLARFEAMADRPGVLVADTAFLLKPELASPSPRAASAWIASHRAAGRQVLAVNASGHTLEKMAGDGVSAHVAALSTWLAAAPDRAVILIPHDIRPAPAGDLEAAEGMAGPLIGAFGDRVHLLRPPFHAWDLKALMGEVDVLLTGRMHLAIAALGMTTPILCVVYQGKYEGLMRHFALDGLLMEPEEALRPADVAARLERLLADAPALRARIAGRLPAVMDLARRNFDWLDPAKR